MEPMLIAVMGPTGSGKSDVAEWLADVTGAQLVNADAFQVYRRLDIGTNKPIDRSRYRLLDLKEPTEDFGVGEWIGLAESEVWSAYRESRGAIVVGGTGLYVRALMEEWSDLEPAPDPALRAALDARIAGGELANILEELRDLAPEVASRVDPENPVRVRRALERTLRPQEPIRFELPPIPTLKLALSPPPAVLDQRLAERTVRLLASGWLDEVRSLAEEGIDESHAAMRAIGYRTLLEVVRERQELDEALLRIQLETRRYAKRQRTWLRSEPRVRLFDTLQWERLQEQILEALKSPDQPRKKTNG